MKKIGAVSVILLLLCLFSSPLLRNLLASPCPCTGGTGGSYTYDCTCCGSKCYDPPGTIGKCCISWPAGSCGCPSATGCASDTCGCSVGACGGGGDDDDCSQPCGGCFDCGACASQVSLPENTLLMLSFSEAKFGEVSDEEISRCQQSRNPG